MSESSKRVEDAEARIQASHMLFDPEEEGPWEAVHPRSISVQQWDRFRRYIGEIFEAFGMELDAPGTIRTPERFLKATTASAPT